MSEKKTVDEIWKQLKSNTAPRRLESRQRVKKVGLHGSGARSQAPEKEEGKSVESGGESGGQNERETAGRILPQAAVGDENDLSSHVAKLRRDINCLSTPDRNKRLQSILKLKTELVEGNSAVSPEILQGLVSGPLLRPAIAMLSDPVERCREASLQLLMQSMCKLTDVAPLLSALLPAISNRMGKIPVQETTEELRLMLVEMIGGPVIERGGTVLKDYLSEVVPHVCRALEDPFHEVNKAGCAAIVRLCHVLPAGALEPNSKEIAKCLVGVMGHPHSRVRQAALQALDALIINGVSSGVLQEVIVPSLKGLGVDHAAQVRQMCFEVVAGWMGANRSENDNGLDSMFYSRHLLPVLLLGVSDESPETAQTCLHLVESVGEAYCAQLSKNNGENIAENETGSSQMDIDTAREEGVDEVAVSGLVKFLGHPFARLPSRCSQDMAVLLMPEILSPILQSMSAWTRTERNTGMRTLKALVPFAGHGCGKHFEKILPALCGGIGDEDGGNAGLAISTAHVLGAYLPVPDWIHLVLDFLLSPRNGHHQKASCLVLLSGLLYAGSCVDKTLDGHSLQYLVQGLCKEEIRLCDHSGVQAQLSSVVTNLIRLGGPLCKDVSFPLYQLLLQLEGSRDGGNGGVVLEHLAKVCGLSEARDLSSLHGSGILDQCIEGHEEWVDGAPGCVVFCSLLRQMGHSALKELFPRITPVITRCIGDHERDPNLRLRFLRLVDDMLEDKSVNEVLGGENAEHTVCKLILPALVWRVGKTAASIRFASVTALSTFVSYGLTDAAGAVRLMDEGGILPLVFQSMEEDRYAETRNMACYVLSSLITAAGGLLSDSHRRQIYPEVLKRLDDSSNEIRRSACAALSSFVSTMPDNYCDTNAGYLLSGMLIHMDDSEVAIQEAVYKVVEALARVKPAVVRKEVEKVKDRFLCKALCGKVLELCNAGG